MSLDDDVAEIVEGYRVARREEAAAVRWRYRRAAPAATRKAASRIQRAAAELLAALETAPPVVRDGVLAVARARITGAHFGDWQPGDLLEEELTELVDAASGLAGRVASAREKPGPRADKLRLVFAVAIARALEQHGKRVTGYQTGVYARTLRDAWHKASGYNLAEDLRPLLRAVLRALRDGTR